MIGRLPRGRKTALDGLRRRNSLGRSEEPARRRGRFPSCLSLHSSSVGWSHTREICPRWIAITSTKGCRSSPVSSPRAVCVGRPCSRSIMNPARVTAAAAQAGSLQAQLESPGMPEARNLTPPAREL
jgi:hypothetical protein